MERVALAMGAFDETSYYLRLELDYNEDLLILFSCMLGKCSMSVVPCSWHEGGLLTGL